LHFFIYNKHFTFWKYMSAKRDFFDAIVNGDEIEALNLLKANAFDPNIRESTLRSSTAVALAARTGKDELVRELISLGADVNYHDGTMAPIHMALRASTAQLLIDAGAEVNAGWQSAGIDLAKGTTALHTAASGNNVELVRVLLSAGANANARDADGKTPLHSGSMNADVVDALLAAGANIEARTRNGQSAQDLIEHFSRPPSPLPATAVAQQIEAVLSGKRDSVPEPLEVATVVIRRAEPRSLSAVNEKNSYGMYPIDVAAQAADVARFREIVDHPDFDPALGRPDYFAHVGRVRDGYSMAKSFDAMDREIEAFDARFPLVEGKRTTSEYEKVMIEEDFEHAAANGYEPYVADTPVARPKANVAEDEVEETSKGTGVLEVPNLIRKASREVESAKAVSVADDSEDNAPAKIRSADKVLTETPKAPLKTLLGGRFIGDENGNYRRPGEKVIALRDENNEIVLNDKQMDTFMAGLELAKAKGWSAIEVEGSKRFRREAWLRAQQEGMEVVGYEPTSLDMDTLAQMLEKAGADQIAPGVSASLDEAKSIAVSSGKGFVAPNYDNGSYAGSVLGETEHHYLVSVDGRAGTATAVEKARLEGVSVKPGELLKVKFQSGKAQGQREQGRSLSR